VTTELAPRHAPASHVVVPATPAATGPVRPVRRFGLLGPLEVADAAGPVHVVGRTRRALLVRLLLDRGRVVTVDRLVDDLWGAAATDRAAANLYTYVSKLRRILDGGITSGPLGYSLVAEEADVDADRFAALVDEAGDAALAADDAGAAERYRAALALWRGPALAEVADAPWAGAEASRLDDWRLGAVESCAAAELRLGRHAELVEELATLAAEHPFRERLWEHLMTALYRCGRQADALRAFQRARTALVEELGLEPGVGLRDLERRVLAQDPLLSAPSGTRSRRSCPWADRPAPASHTACSATVGPRRPVAHRSAALPLRWQRRPR
jgi:DNA-binding SARP family transcriptional activator